MAPSTKVKLVLIGTSGVIIFMLGRATAPKPTTEIRIIDKTKSISKSKEETRNRVREQQHKQIVIERHTEKDKLGLLKTDMKETISYAKDTSDNSTTNYSNQTSLINKENIDVKNQTRSISYTVMAGRSLQSPQYDYIASIGLPVFKVMKADVGYELFSKKIFIGATFNF